MKNARTSQASSTSGGELATEGAPGKRALTSALPAGAGAVQRRATVATLPPAPGGAGASAAPAHEDPFALHLLGDAAVQRRGEGAAAGEDVHAAAAHGIGGPATSLPHLAQIQRAFGPDHDLSTVQAHVGGPAAAASAAMGAEAYATGGHVAFASQPDLHTAAHEAAHVVQQAQGVHLYGGVGQAGDTYERHADAVADRVVAGRSAADLLGAPGPGSAPVVQHKKGTLPTGDEGFEQMWAAHPHNYQADDAENTSSPDVLDQHGLPASYSNTCAIRISIMFNEIGDPITVAKATGAGIKKERLHYSKKTKKYYILSAKEMWTYLTAHYRKPDVTFPTKGRYADEEKFRDDFEATIKPLLAGKKGIVAFDKVFGYGGTGHVDIFDGETLSNAAGWYSCQRLMLWYVSVP
ncbi:MAG: DUF4157 domain-containing protein [Kofleriaceae bacterium]|nr:DUF4157 domain-containing protein [Kofleriaceae bacterium]MCL4223589.1 DUF4157 domain-containing protein [Myxococcales bacterium]